MVFSKTLSIGTVYKSVSCISSIKSWSDRRIAASGCRGEWEAGKKTAKGQAGALHLPSAAVRTFTLVLALAASFSKSQCFPLLTA